MLAIYLIIGLILSILDICLYKRTYFFPRVVKDRLGPPHDEFFLMFMWFIAWPFVILIRWRKWGESW